MALWSRFFGSAGSQAVGVAMGAAAVPALVPYSQDLINSAWEGHQSHPLLAAQIAVGVAQGKVDYKWAKDEAARTGINEDRFKVLIAAAKSGPGVSAAFDMWRRGEIDLPGFKEALGKEGLEDKWIEHFVEEKTDRLSPQQVSLAIVRSLMADPGFLPVTLNTANGTVPAYGVSSLDPVTEAAANGIDKERLRIMVGEIGLPMALESAASATFRGIINRADFNRAVLEGDTRPEWADAIFEAARQIQTVGDAVASRIRGDITDAEMHAQAAKHGMSAADVDAIYNHTRQIPTARDFLENALRGYHDLAWAQQQAKRHGMSDEDALIIYQNQGRSMAIRQITQALSRGASFNPEPGEITDPYHASVVEGNLKPAYYEMAEALKYTLPSPFVMRQLTTSGVWSEQKAAKRLKDSGWIPQDADEAAHAWAQGSGSGPDSHIAKAQTQLWSTLHRSYLAGDTAVDVATEKLQALGLAAGTITAVLALWDHERDVIRARMTAAQVKKAWVKLVPNPLTGQPWTREEALEELLSRGWSSQDANTYLDE